MEIRHLRSFVALSGELNFRRAAEYLHISQSALSKQIRALENELGERLFLRTKHAVRPTPAGTAFLEHARLIIHWVDVAMRAVTSAGHGKTGRLEVGFCEGMEIRTIPSIFRRFRRRYPGVDLGLHALPSSEQAEAVRRGRLDLGFVHLPLPGNSIAVDRLDPEPLFLAVPEGHRLSRSGEAALKDLHRENFILLTRQRAPIYHDLVLSLAREAGIVLNVRMEPRNFTDTLSVVAAGLGVSVIPSSCRELALKGVSYSRLKPRVTRLQTGIISRQDEASELVGNFLAVARSAAG